MKREETGWLDGEIALEAARWTWWPESATVVEDERRLLVHMPGASGKSVVYRSSAADGRRAESLIEETIADVRAAGNPELVWHMNGATEPDLTAGLLAERGFEIVEDLEVLAFELGDGPEPGLQDLDVPAGVAAGRTRDADEIREMYRIKSVVFSSEPSEEEIAALAKDLEKRDQADGALALGFLAFIEGEPAASAGMQVVGEVARLWGGGTLERFRRRGAYRAQIAERCRVAHALGAARPDQSTNRHREPYPRTRRFPQSGHGTPLRAEDGR